MNVVNSELSNTEATNHRLIVWLSLNDKGLLVNFRLLEVASSLGVRSSVYCISGQNKLIDWLIEVQFNL